ncbi:MAG: hypothetical protein JO187_05000, partial [Acidobacteria bacterium]|nr:hypothetical protein [Acidobacteriota bacterium]
QPSPPVTDAEIARAKKSKATAVGSTGSAAKRPGVAGAPVNSTIRWTISPAGAVQCSTDNGAHWQDISIAEGKTFRTLAASGSEVWAGGSALYHSSDFGADWAPVNVGNKQQAMEGEITRIQLPSETRVEVTTSAGQNWTSGDGGRTWSLQ